MLPDLLTVPDRKSSVAVGRIGLPPRANAAGIRAMRAQPDLRRRPLARPLGCSNGSFSTVFRCQLHRVPAPGAAAECQSAMLRARLRMPPAARRSPPSAGADRVACLGQWVAAQGGANSGQHGNETLMSNLQTMRGLPVRMAGPMRRRRGLKRHG